MNAFALVNAKGRSQAALSDTGERGLGPSPKREGREKRRELSIRQQPPSLDSTTISDRQEAQTNA